MDEILKLAFSPYNSIVKSLALRERGEGVEGLSTDKLYPMGMVLNC